MERQLIPEYYKEEERYCSNCYCVLEDDERFKCTECEEFLENQEDEQN